MSSEVFIVRHGEIDNPNQILYGDSFDLLLNEEGKNQIRHVAIIIEKTGTEISVICTSPLTRAVQTAEILRSELGGNLDVRIEKDLRDVHIPFLVGKPLALRSEIHGRGTDEYSEEFVRLGNESRDGIVKRMYEVYDRIIRNNQGKNVVIVSHGDPIRFLLFAIEHPDEIAPSMHILAKTEYPNKGAVVKITVGDNFEYLGKEVLV